MEFVQELFQFTQGLFGSVSSESVLNLIPSKEPAQSLLVRASTPSHHLPFHSQLMSQLATSHNNILGISIKPIRIERYLKYESNEISFMP
jgi:hypothetical protein